MPGYNLVDSTTKEPVGKLPMQIEGKPYRILRFVEPNSRKRPSGELVLQHQTNPPEIVRAAPPVFGLMLVPRP